MDVAEDRLQEGIHFRSGDAAPAAYRLLLLDAQAGASPAALRSALAEVLAMLRELRVGRPRELAGLGAEQARAGERQFASLQVLIGYGARLFAREPALVAAERPDYLVALREQPSAFPALPWALPHEPGNRGEADVALQLTADNAAAVNCAAVEVAKLIADAALPVGVAASFDGFLRLDGRGWLEFHDGVSNLPVAQRLAALAAVADPPWMEGGTYMAFLRLRIDLAAWRSLTRAEQELLVGRDKLSGMPLVAVRREAGALEPVADPPPAGTTVETARAAYADPPQTTDPLLEASHIHRANQNRASAFAPGGLRIFRQGYDFLERVDGPGGPRLGLNFVSFQRDLATLEHLLHLPGWLGDVNFGGPVAPGPGEPAPLRFIELLAGGLYAVPPRARPFPGAALFA